MAATDFETLDSDAPGELPLGNDWTIRRKDIRGINNATGELENAPGTGGTGWLSDTEDGPPIHADLVVPVVAVAGKNIALGTLDGDVIRTHLAGRVGERVWEVVTLGLNDDDYTDSVSLRIVASARPRGVARG